MSLIIKETLLILGLVLVLFTIFDIRCVYQNRHIISEDIWELFGQFLKWLPKQIKAVYALIAVMIYCTKLHTVPVVVCVVLFTCVSVLAVCEFFNPKFLD